VIDAHQHFWQLGQHDCTWPTPDLQVVYRDFGIDDLRPLALQHQVTGSVLVQSQASDKDTDFLLALAEQTDFIKAVVGWVDLAARNAPGRIAELAQHKKLRALRPMLQNLDDDNWILRAEIKPAIAAMQEHNLGLDALVFTRHLSGLYRFALAHPQLPIVIDHAAKPPISSANENEFNQWAKAMAAMAELPQVYCKISGLLTEAAASQGAEDFIPYIDYIYRHFGAQRVMWGSDWPVLMLAPNESFRSYGSWLTLAKSLVARVSNAEVAPVEQEIFSAAVARFYRFPLGSF